MQRPRADELPVLHLLAPGPADGPGTVNAKGLDFYRRLVDGLHERGIAPMATLFHWDLPQALQDAGGWENRDCAYWFADYADVVFRALGDEVPTWLTLNEPKTVVQNGYPPASTPPGSSDRGAAYVVAHHLLLGHGLAVQALPRHRPQRPHRPRAQPAPLLPGRRHRRGRAAAPPRRRLREPALPRPDPARPLPGGRAGRPRPPDAPVRAAIRDGDLASSPRRSTCSPCSTTAPIYVTGTGGRVHASTRPSQASWQQIYPEGMYDILTRVNRDYGDIPLTITENGLPSPTAGPDGT